MEHWWGGWFPLFASGAAPFVGVLAAFAIERIRHKTTLAQELMKLDAVINQISIQAQNAVNLKKEENRLEMVHCGWNTLSSLFQESTRHMTGNIWDNVEGLMGSYTVREGKLIQNRDIETSLKSIGRINESAAKFVTYTLYIPDELYIICIRFMNMSRNHCLERPDRTPEEIEQALSEMRSAFEKLRKEFRLLLLPATAPAS